MTRRYTGGLLSATEQITDANTANGIFTMQEAGALTAAGNFPTGRWTPQRSLRCRASASAYLSRTPSVASGQNQWTLSTWVKRGLIGSAQHIIGGNTTTSGGTRNVLQVEFGSDNAFWVFGFTNASGYYFQRTSNQLFRDPTAWYHVVVQFDPDNSISANKVIVYINGQPLTWATSSDSGAAGNISSSAYRSINNTYRNDINGGYQGGGVPIYFGDGYLSEMYMVSGSIVAPSDFAMTDPQTGTLIPKRYTGSYGTNGFYLDFRDNSSTGNLALDRSGNSNNWTSNNISVTAGSTYDSMVDVPGIASVTSQPDVGGVVRGNYATLNPLALGSTGTSVLSSANLSFVNSSVHASTTSTIGVSSGKWYWEGTITSSSAGGFGFTSSTAPYSAYPGEVAGLWWIYDNTGTFNINNQATTTFSGSSKTTTGAVWQIALDMDTGKAWFGINNVWYDSAGGTTGSPLTGANPTWSPLPLGTTMHAFLECAGQAWAANFGQRPFTYTPPTGFKSLNTTNFPNPVIKRPSEHFDIKTYNGNGGSQSIGVNPKQMASIPVNKSLRFRSNVSAYLTRTPTVAGNRTTWTWSGWIKRGSLGAAQWIFDGWQDGSNFTQISFTAGNAINIQNITSGTTDVLKTTTSLYSRTDAWYHIVFSVDTTQGTALNRFRIYVNGVQVTSFSTDTNTLAQNGLTFINSTNPHNIGRYATANYFDGYMADINFVDGQALTPGSFGTFDANNNWLPKTYTGTYGTNGFYLPMTSSGESYSADVLVVAGGGSGSGGGGGGGGVIPTTATFAVGKTYTVSVGAGGTAAGRGTDSRIVGVSCEYTAIGGGGGYQSGGSGGGSWEPNSVGGAGTSGQGYKGGNAGGAVGNYGCGGGGGGGGAAGTNGSGTTPGTGGVGYQSAITGTNTYYAGGGGGGSPDSRYPRTTAGGLGGGGTSYYGSADAGTPNTGGGGGTSYPPLGVYGAGGSGVVILRIPTANYTGTVTGSPTVTTDGSFKVVKFTTSGSYTA